MTNLGKADWTQSERVQRMAKTYKIRYDATFWNTLHELLPKSKRKAIADFGCGPGLLLRDLAHSYDADQVFALDESEEMLSQAEQYLSEGDIPTYSTYKVNLDLGTLPLDKETLSMAFCGFMLHEVADPKQFVTMVSQTLVSEGAFVVYDFVSGDKDAFLRVMTAQGMDSARAEKRYPHMCKHSVEDIKSLLKAAGLSKTKFVVMDGMRALVVAFK